MPIEKARSQISQYRQQRKKELTKRNRQFRMVNLSLTSMVDLFAILVIFLLANTSSVSKWVTLEEKIDLPNTKTADSVEKQGITVEISKEKLRVGKKEVLFSQMTSESLETFLLETFLLEKNKNSLSPFSSSLHLAADIQTPYSMIRKVITLAKSSGLTHLNLVTQPFQSN